jgi:hypothetical protein
MNGSKGWLERAVERFDVWCRRSMLVLPVLVLLSPALRTPGFREDEIQCEEARAHIEECCPEYRGNLLCLYDPDVGCNESTYPDLTANESGRIQGLSCPDVIASGLCTREFDHAPVEDH